VTYQPGWYPDPYDPQRVRWFDGQQWTQHSAPAQAAPSPPSRKLSTSSIVLIVVGAILLLCAIAVIVAGFAFVAFVIQGVVCGESPHYCT
jgi:hypothetical protein